MRLQAIRGRIAALAAAAVLGASASAAELRLRLEPAAFPYLPGDTIFVVVSMAELGTDEAAGFQAFLAFDGDEVDFVAGSYFPEPFGLPVIPIITASGEDIDMASGVDVFAGQAPTSADGDLAILVFEAVDVVCQPDLVFRDVYPPSRITDDSGTEILPLELVELATVLDCNGNDVEDSCDIASGASRDCNFNDVPDECETLTCPADLVGPGFVVPPDGFVNIFDFLFLLSQWGADGCADFSSAVFNVPDGVVDIFDFLHLLAQWGSCP